MFGLPIWAIWLILCGIFLIIEIFTISFLFLWPGIGAFLAFIVNISGGSLTAQITVFALSSIILILCTKPLVKKLFKTNDKVALNNKSIIGKNGIALKTINYLDFTGQVKVSGEIWSAQSLNDEVIEKGSTVLIDSIDGVKLKVKKI